MASRSAFIPAKDVPKAKTVSALVSNSNLTTWKGRDYFYNGCRLTLQTANGPRALSSIVQRSNKSWKRSARSSPVIGMTGLLGSYLPDFQQNSKRAVGRRTMVDNAPASQSAGHSPRVPEGSSQPVISSLAAPLGARILKRRDARSHGSRLRATVGSRLSVAGHHGSAGPSSPEALPPSPRKASSHIFRIYRKHSSRKL